MVKLTSSLVSVLLLACSLELAAAYKAPKISNDTDDDVNLGIVNGKISDHYTFPFITYILTDKDPSRPGSFGACTGSILNEYFVITAAHCVVDSDADRAYPANQITTYVGISSTSDPNIANRGYLVSRVFVHPDYIASNETVGHSDVAVLQLSKPIQSFDGVMYGCVDYSESIESYYYVVGYGQTAIVGKDKYGNTKTEEKNTGELRYAYAKETRNAPYCLREGMNNLCLDSYYPGSGQAICYGDSGGPVLTPYKKIRGVASVLYARYDPQTGYYAFCNGRQAYTRLSRFRNFIDSHVGSSNYCWSS